MSVRVVCPKCKGPDGLWATASFEGWHAVDVLLEGNFRMLSAVRRGTPCMEVTGAEGYDLDPHEMGCSCGWEGTSDDLVQLGLDGELLPDVSPAQLSIGAGKSTELMEGE